MGMSRKGTKGQEVGSCCFLSSYPWGARTLRQKEKFMEEQNPAPNPAGPFDKPDLGGRGVGGRAEKWGSLVIGLF